MSSSRATPTHEHSFPPSAAHMSSIVTLEDDAMISKVEHGPSKMRSPDLKSSTAIEPSMKPSTGTLIYLNVFLLQRFKILQILLEQFLKVLGTRKK